MNTHYNTKFGREIITIYPGETYTSQEDEIISTVIGSCISVALYDRKNCFGGLNHFMLARDCGTKITTSRQEKGCFGEYAVKQLIDDMIANGADYDSLVAKVFGGSSLLNISGSGNQVSDVNIQFAFEYLENEKIPVIGSDTGGSEPRKIFFETKTAKIWLKRLQTSPDLLPADQYRFL
jgi:chemotaxis protein CheD